MATRFEVGGSVGYGPTVDARGVAAQHQITPEIIDMAVEDVFSAYNVEPAKAQALRGILGNDVTSGVAKAYYGGLASKGMHEARVQAMRKTLDVPYALTDEQSARLVAYAPDFKLRIQGSESHDHPLYAAQRTVDQMVCESRMPPGVRCADLGANVLHHVKVGHSDWHLCNPRIDPKDPVRSTLTNLAVKRLTTKPGVQDRVRDAAVAYLSGQTGCGGRAQDCAEQSDAAVCVHVYDIPMSDWAGIMDRKGLRLVEGCMLLSEQLYAHTVGRFETAGLRYEVNARENVFRMGFEGSPSWWYTHKLDDHLQYGADQILYGNGSVYSYKVVERRGDTIFYRILKLAGHAKPNAKQYFKLPGIPMVTVAGYDLALGGKQKIRREWTWPRPLWEEMVGHAADMFERGSYSTEKMFNRYRSAAPRQTINSVVVTGGFEVDLAERAALVVYSSMEALLMVSRSQAGFRLMIEGQSKERARAGALGFTSLVRSIGKVVTDGVGVIVEPLVSVTEKVVDVLEGVLDEFSVVPQVQLRLLPARLVLSGKWSPSRSVAVEHTDAGFSAQVLAAAPAQYLTAAYSSGVVADVVRDMFGDALPPDVVAAMPTAKEIEVEVAASIAPGSTVAGSVTAVASGVAYDVSTTKAAIQEAIVETEIERKNVEASCRTFMTELMGAGGPSERLLETKREEAFFPDFWYVNSGVIGESFLGRPAEDFDKSAVCLPIMSSEGSYLHPVKTQIYKGRSKGQVVEREHSYIDATGYTGWAFSNDSLTVYNGPEVVRSMEAALAKLEVPLVVVRSGPPGCGKTTIIVKSVREGEVVLCPARASVFETRGRIRETRKDIAFPVLERCRTVDSYLVNYGRSKQVTELRTDLLRGDEGYMCRAGRWLACAILLGAKSLYLYGDDQQIPHVPRALVPTMHVKIRADEVVNDWVSWRNPADSVASYGDLYDWRVRSGSKKGRSLWLMSDVASRPISDEHVMLCMYQDEKAVIRKLYSASGKSVRVMTVHEAQGNTFKCVRLHRFIRGKAQVDGEDRFDLFKRTPYVLVAMSRHTDTFEYLSEMGVEDEVVKRIKQGLEVRRSQRAADVASAGVSMEFI